MWALEDNNYLRISTIRFHHYYFIRFHSRHESLAPFLVSILDSKWWHGNWTQWCHTFTIFLAVYKLRSFINSDLTGHVIVCGDPINNKPGQPTAFDLFIAFNIGFHQHKVDDYHALNSAQMQSYKTGRTTRLKPETSYYIDLDAAQSWTRHILDSIIYK